MFILTVYVIYSPNNPDNIFLNKNINRLLVDIFKSEYSVKYTDDFKDSNVILFAENIKLIKDFIDTNELKYRKCVAITQEVYHETTEDIYQEYNTNQIYIYNCFNKKFYLNHFYNFYGIPGGKIDISNKTKDNYSTELYFFGNIWRQNWEQKQSLYRKRTQAAVDGYKEKFISKLYSRDFYGISLTNIEPKNMKLEQDIIEIQEFVNRNISREEKIILTKNLFYSIEFLPTDYTNFTSERPFDAICSGCVPIFMGTDTLKQVFPIDSIIYVDEFPTPLDCFKYVKNLSYDEWKIRINKCIDIVFKSTREGKTGDNLIFQLFKNIVDDLFKDLPLFDVYIFCSGKSGGTTLCNSFFQKNITTAHMHSGHGKAGYITNINTNFTYETIMYSSLFKNIFIFDIYRTPIERQISSFFESYYLQYADINNTQELCNIFTNNYLFKIENYCSIEIILQYFGLPMFNNFNFEKKYNVIEKDNLTLVYLLFENFDKFPDIIKTITNYDIDICNLNCSWQKSYKNAYKEFKEIFTCPLKFLPKLLCDNYFNTFVDPQEKSTYLKKHFSMDTSFKQFYYELNINYNKNNFMINLFNSDTPFFLTRHGGTDFVTCEAYFNSLNIQTIFNLYNEKVKEYCGYFDKSDDLGAKLMNFEKYLRKINSSLDNSFILTTCVSTKNLTDATNNENTKKWLYNIIKNRIILPYSYIENVMPFLNDFKIFGENKKILIISAFSKTIEIQYKKKDYLISGYKYPNFELVTYDIPITYNINGVDDNLYLNDIKFNDWNELVENMCQEVNKISFDIALISAGSYTYPLGDYISSNMKKKAIYIGGILNVLFAIRSNRYHVKGSGYEKINPSDVIIESIEKNEKTQKIKVGRNKKSEAISAYFG